MGQESEAKASYEEAGHQAVYAEKAEVEDYKAEAIEAENAEHQMTVMEAVKAYPMASFWAFIMSFTIVSYRSQLRRDQHIADSSDHGILRCLPYR
jgi:galactose-1-phosphate uridylyltransferase